VGQIASVDRVSVTLHDCELVTNTPA
jgi:hypothetical protein